MTDKQLYNLCQQYGREARKWKNKFIALLPEVYKRRLYRKKGFCSIHEFAAKIAGVSKNVVDQTLRVFEKTKDLPELQSKIEKHGIHKVRVVSNIANKETDKFWADNVEELSKGALELKVQKIRNSDPGIGTPKCENPDQQAQIDLFEQSRDTPNMSTRQRFGMDLDLETIIQFRLVKQKFEKERGEALCWDDVIKMAAEILLKEKLVREYKQKPSKSRPIPAKKRREMPKVCEIEGCNKPAEEVHHEEPWSIFKSHKNIKAVCKGHHELEHQSDSPVDVKFRKYKMAASCG
jgi:hypothetical protein